MQTKIFIRLLTLIILPLTFFVFSCDRNKEAHENSQKKTLTEANAFTEPTTNIEFVFIKGGCYQMGDVFGGGDRDEKPVHNVCVDDFYIGKYEVTQGQWHKVMGDNPSKFKKGDNYPVEQASWYDVYDFISKLNRITEKQYRLPTEAEWEYAARSGGKEEKFAGSSEESKLYKYANFCDKNCEEAWKAKSQDDRYKNTSPVGKHNPNGLGLYDMSGNVYEWMQDWYDVNYYKNSPRKNPQGPSSGQEKIIRGGSWNSGPMHLRAVNRDGLEPSKNSSNLGFRLVFSAR